MVDTQQILSEWEVEVARFERKQVIFLSLSIFSGLIQVARCIRISSVRLNNVPLYVYTTFCLHIHLLLSSLSFTALQIHQLQQDHESAVHNHVSVCQGPLWLRNYVLHYFLSLCSVGIPCLWHSGWWLQYFPRVYVSIYETKKKNLIRDVTAFSRIKDKSSWLLFNHQVFKSNCLKWELILFPRNIDPPMQRWPYTLKCWCLR